MKANELRIGNLVQDEEGIFPITETYFNLLKLNLETTEPIPLTEELLLRLNYIKKGKYFVCPDNSTRVYKTENSNDYWFELGYDTDNDTEWRMLNNFEFLHQLQNLYFAITGSELTFKN